MAFAQPTKAGFSLKGDSVSAIEIVNFETR
jgi:hypothetical protein